MKYTFLLLLLITGCSLFTPALHETQDLTFKNKDGLNFTGTLYTPKTAPPYPLLVLAHGSGNFKRNSKPYAVYGKYFSDHGFAVFLFDKRGIGDSEGNYSDETYYLDSLASDLTSAYEFIQSSPLIDSKRAGILGVSQGGWVIPLALQNIKSISYVVSVSGPSIPPYLSDLTYDADQYRKDGFTDSEVTEIIDYNRIISEYVGNFKDREKAIAAKKKYSERPWFKKLGFRSTLSPEDTLRLSKYNHYRREMFDPAPYWNKPEIPTLTIFGAKDAHIPVDTCMKRFDSIFQENKYSDYTIKEFKNLGHIMQRVEGEKEVMNHNLMMLINGFPEPDEEYLQYVEKWIKSKTGVK